jgi:hypothetical protein
MNKEQLKEINKIYKEWIKKEGFHFTSIKKLQNLILHRLYKNWIKKEGLQPIGKEGEFKELYNREMTDKQAKWLDGWIEMYNNPKKIEELIKKQLKGSIKKIEKRLEKKSGLYNYD